MSDAKSDGAALFTVLPTDTRWYGVMLKGPELCSRCKQAIDEDDVPIRAWPADGRWEVHYHPACLGFESFPDDDVEEELRDG